MEIKGDKGRQSFWTWQKIAASLSKALASFAPASPTAKEPFRDAYGIQISNNNSFSLY